MNMISGPSPLEAQTKKLFRHIRTGSYKTRAQYMGKCLNFARFCHNTYKVSNIRNINTDHLAAYIVTRQKDDIAGTTICDDLSAIRFLMHHVSNPRYQILTNVEIEEQYDLLLGNEPLNPGNRAWAINEYETFIQTCENISAYNPIDVSVLCISMGLRITEAVASTRSQAEYALRTREYQVKHEAKNGRWRKVPLSPEAEKMFLRRLPEVPRGGHLFIKPDQKTHMAVNEHEHFLRCIRGKIISEEGFRTRSIRKSAKTFTNEITWHGLRYSYAQNKMKQLLLNGFSYDAARQIVSQDLGHNRLSVVDVYIGKKGCYLDNI